MVGSGRISHEEMIRYINHMAVSYTHLDKGSADHGGQAGGAPGRSHVGGKIPGGPSKGTPGELPRTPLSSPVCSDEAAADWQHRAYEL